MRRLIEDDIDEGAIYPKEYRKFDNEWIVCVIVHLECGERLSMKERHFTTVCRR